MAKQGSLWFPQEWYEVRVGGTDWQDRYLPIWYHWSQKEGKSESDLYKTIKLIDFNLSRDNVGLTEKRDVWLGKWSLGSGGGEWVSKWSQWRWLGWALGCSKEHIIIITWPIGSQSSFAGCDNAHTCRSWWAWNSTAKVIGECFIALYQTGQVIYGSNSSGI